MTRNEKSKTRIGGDAVHRYFGGSLATLTASSMTVSKCTLFVDGTSSPFVLKSSSSNTAPSTVELVHTNIIASDAVMGPVSEIESSEIPCQFDIVVFSTNLDSICVMGGNSLLFRHSVDQNAESTSSSTRCVGSTITKSIGALQGTIISDINSGGSLLCSNTTITKSTPTSTPSRDILVHQQYSPFIAKYTQNSRPEFVFKDTSFTDQKQHKFWSLFQQEHQLVRGQNTYFTPSVSSIIFSNCTFSELNSDPNDDHFKGGLAIHLQTPAPLTITSCSFINLTCKGCGSAIYSEYASGLAHFATTILINDSTFTRCNSSMYGGSLFVGGRGSRTIVSSIFTQNYGQFLAGACYSRGGDYSFCRFEGNEAEKGGAICEEGHASIRFCRFQNNVASEGPDFLFDESPETLLGCTRSEEDWEGGAEVVVMESGEGEECSASQPCQTLTEGLYKASMNGKDIIHVGSGWTGSTTIEQSVGHLTLRGFYPLEEASRNTPTQTSSFSITVGQDSNITLDSFALLPKDGLPLLTCESSGGCVIVTDVQIEHIEGISTPLHILGRLTCSEEISIRPSFPSHRHTLLDFGLSKCVPGVAAIDVNECASLDLSSSTFSLCHSKVGRAGALSINLTDYSSFRPNVFFINNKGETDADAHDILFCGVPQPPLTQESLSDIHSFSPSPQIIDGSNPHPILNYPVDLAIMEETKFSYSYAMANYVVFTQNVRHINFQQIVDSQNKLYVEIADTTQIPVALPALQLSSFDLFFYSRDTFFFPKIQKSLESEGSFISADDSEVGFEYLSIVLSSMETDPFIVLSISSILRLTECLFTSDGSVLNYPIIRSSGEIVLKETSFTDITFDSHSCIEIDDGTFTQTGPQVSAAAFVSNITTSGNGSFLNARNCVIAFQMFSFFDCHAENGGVLFCRDCTSIFLDRLIALRCSAMQNGGAICIDSTSTSTVMDLAPSLSECSAELGGGMFINVTRPYAFTLKGSQFITVFGERHSCPTFSNCSASKGGGAFFDGDWSGVRELSCSSLFMSNGGFPSIGHDLFFTASAAGSMPDFSNVIRTLAITSSSLSSRSRPTSRSSKHVEIEGGSVPSFNIDAPKLTLTSVPTDDNCVMGPITQCASIRRLLDLFHTQNEDGEFNQVAVFLGNDVYFFETGVVRSQSVFITKDPSSNSPTQVRFIFGNAFWEDDSFFVRVVDDGTAELSEVPFTWEADVGFCEVADEWGKMTITSSTFDVKTDLTQSLIVCSAGEIVVTHSTFTSTDSTVEIKCPLVASFPLSSLSTNTSPDLFVVMENVTFSDLSMDGYLGAVIEYVSDSEFPRRGTGFDELLDEADAHLQLGFPSRILVTRGTVLSWELDLTHDLTEIKALGGEKSRVKVLRDGSLVNQADTLTHSLTLDSLLFSVSAGRMTSLLVSRSGMLTLASCSFISSDSSTLTTKLIEVSGGSVKLVETDFTLVSFSTTLLSFSSFESVYLQHVSHRSCLSHTLMSFEGSTSKSPIEMRDCVFAGEPTPTNSTNEDDTICEWDTGLIAIENCSFEGFSSTFSRLPLGALRVIDASVSLKTSQFELNGPRISSFPSLSWNIACTGSSVIELDSSSSDVSASHWISASELCVVRRSDESHISEPFFIPTLSLDNCSSTYSSTSKHYSVVISGSTLIPCSLSLIVFEVNNNTEGNSLPFALPSSFASHHNDTSISLEIHASSLKELDTTIAWNASLGFGNDGRTSSFRMKRSDKEIRAEAMGKTLPWLIPLIVSLIAILLVIVIVILCLRRKAKSKQKMNEMKEQDTIEIEEEKVEIVQDSRQGFHVNDPKDPLSSRPIENTSQHDIPSSKFDPFENLVEALLCGQRLEVRAVREQDTLYNMLHVSTEKKSTIQKSVISRQLALGLVKVADASPNATILTKLSSHWVMFDSSGSVCLKTRDASPANPPPIPLPNPNALQNSHQNKDQQQMNHAQEGLRWRAPEVVKEENEKVTENEQAVIDPRKAAVFSLGLVLWEIETGLVPFAEQDATNAQRQLGTGILPKMDGVRSEMKDLISECLQLNPSDRPSLSDVSTRLNSLATPKQTDAEEAHSD
ncbi:hypothetical protein BLNAU_15286 [Blattamonas nauphoetae]|uniref:Protein kinase domain-containing protein n=1 Tax=Blattamonas nauphoetae TaxID=2049346 RepID=A0ABQ9XDM9_9EUKA|nr:hypothetical protein BLNAU_15286 [Blattamonas nauphoetae]